MSKNGKDLSKLPVWARTEIKRLERQLEAAQVHLDAFAQSVPRIAPGILFQAAGGDFDSFRRVPDSQVAVNTPFGNFVVTPEERGLHVRLRDDALMVLPSCSNVVVL